MKKKNLIIIISIAVFIVLSVIVGGVFYLNGANIKNAKGKIEDLNAQYEEEKGSYTTAYQAIIKGLSNENGEVADTYEISKLDENLYALSAKKDILNELLDGYNDIKDLNSKELASEKDTINARKSNLSTIVNNVDKLSKFEKDSKANIEEYDRLAGNLPKPNAGGKSDATVTAFEEAVVTFENLKKKFEEAPSETESYKSINTKYAELCQYHIDYLKEVNEYNKEMNQKIGDLMARYPNNMNLYMQEYDKIVPSIQIKQGSAKKTLTNNIKTKKREIVTIWYNEVKNLELK